MKLLTGFAVVTDSIGKKIAYTFSEVNENGTISESNKKESYVVMDAETLDLISQLAEKVKLRLV